MPLKKSSKNAIGFPPPLLGKRPLRLSILANAKDWLALDKPAGVGLRAHPWDSAPNLDAALNLQLQAEKPELLRLGASLFGSIYYLDPEITGLALFAKNREGLAEWRNRFGSGECGFTFHLIAGPGAERKAEFQADAPLLPHNVKPKMIPSTAKGKKSFTDFRRLDESVRGFSLWEASTAFFRPHQVRAHAATCGIPALGDEVYNGPPTLTVRQLDPRARRSDLDAPVYSGIGIHLAALAFRQDDETVAIECPRPKQFEMLLRRLGLSLVLQTDPRAG